MFGLSKRQLLSLSIPKTIYFNYRYFGLHGLFSFNVLCSRYVKFRSLKGNVELDGKLTTGCVKIGFQEVSVFDNKFERTIWENYGDIIMAPGFFLGSVSRISNHGSMMFGENFHVSAKSTFICNKKIFFGKDVLVSWECLFMDTDFHQIMDNKTDRCINEDRDIYISDRVWFGCKCIVLKGSEILRDTVIAAGSIVSGKQTVHSCVIADGEVIKSDVSWIR